MEALATVVGFVLTLIVFSYLLGDNFLFRLAMFIFVGLSAAYTTIITVSSVILPLLDSTGEVILVLVALLLTGLLLARPLKQFTPITSLAVAFLVAVGSAVAVVGAITGTLIPLVIQTAQAPRADFIGGMVIVIGVITTLFYFQYFGRRLTDGTVVRGRVGQVLGRVGEWFVALTLGALYGAAIITSLTMLSERVSFLMGGG